MSEDITIYLYAVEPLADAEGVHLFQSDDTFYEAVQHGEAASRIYPDDGQWSAKVNIPVKERRSAYDWFRGIADRLEETYSVDLPKTWLTFQEEYEDTATASDDDITVCYRSEGSLAIPNPGHETPLGSRSAAMIGNLGGGGLGIASVGALTGINPVLDALIFASPGVGALGALGANAGVPAVKNRIGQWKRRRRYGEIDAVRERRFLDQINERNSLERLLDRNQSFPTDLTERYTELEGRALNEALDIVTTAHFERFDELQGINVTGSFDTYEEAAAFRDTVRDRDSEAYERPSLYTAPDAFRSMFEHLTFTMEGEKHVLEDAYRLTETLLEGADADPDISTWLEETHPDIVKQAGQEHALEGGGA